MKKITFCHLIIFVVVIAQFMLNACSVSPDTKAMMGAKEMVKKRIIENGGMLYQYSNRPIDFGSIDYVNTKVVANRGSLFMVEVTVNATDVSGIRLTQYCLSVLEVLPNSDSYHFNRFGAVFTSEAPITSENIQEMKERNEWDAWVFHPNNGE